MSFASQLQSILQKLLINDADRAPYTADAISICNELMDDLKKEDDHFRKAFDGLSLSGSYLDRVKLKTPDEFDMHLKLKLPFQVTPVRDSQRSGFVFLRYTGGSHPAVVDGYVNRKSLQDWIRNAFHKVFESYNQIKKGGETYKLTYTLQGHGCSHTIEAQSPSKFISFDFVPVFEFTHSQWPLPDPASVSHNVRQNWNWFAVPQQKRPADDRTFMVCAPHWEREMMKGNYNLKNILRLMKGMRDKHIREMPHLSSYMLKTVILLQLEKRPDTYWQKDLATLFVDMWTRLVQHFRDNNLPFFLAHDCNHFDRLKRDDFLKCKETAEILYHKINLTRNESKFYLDQLFF
ncbi:uncharacterized protein LOC117789144 [Drosophila innubila]|uniref:uncharacterized protein LOC117789144 n=1 Tax=Drosophila innubila TaxID=198719 RepID=UPI00148D5A64|nr:uncharacterized protein LOC117789144 [Drosophila innubila]